MYTLKTKLGIQFVPEYQRWQSEWLLKRKASFLPPNEMCSQYYKCN